MTEAVVEQSMWETVVPYVTEVSYYNYMIPAIVCLIVYFFRSVKDYRKDLEMCETKYYSPTLTVGVIFWRLLISIVPGINWFALVFDCAGSVFKYFGRTFDFPLVGKRYVEPPKQADETRNQSGSWVEHATKGVRS